MNTADKAIKAFEETGDTQNVVAPSMEPTPSIKLHDEDGENVGKFVQGKYLFRRTSTGQYGEIVYLDVRVSATNATATVKKDQAYVPVPVKEGDIISLYASSRLDKQLRSLEPGTDFIAVYRGLVKEKTSKGKVHAHEYEVKAKKEPILTPADVEYIKIQNSRQQKLNTKALTAAAGAEAKANLDALDNM